MAGAALALTLSGAALADESAAAGVYGGYDLFSGNQGIRTNPSTVTGFAFVHPVQAQTPSLAFVAIGTVKGKGNDGGCDDHYSPTANWSGYWDRLYQGVYACDNFSPNAWSTGSNPSFKIEYTLCAPLGFQRWVMTFSGSLRVCIYMPWTSADSITAGLETVQSNTIDRNIDVAYTNLRKGYPCCTGTDPFGTPIHNESPSYVYHLTSTTAFEVYLAPLD